jgi:hypothetical protein
MKPKEILKRVYCSITCGLFFYIVAPLLKIQFFYQDVIILFAIAFIWLLTIHNSKKERYIYMSIILLIFLWVIMGFNLDSSMHLNKIEIWLGKPPKSDYFQWFGNKLIFYVCGVTVMVAGFCTNTRFDNIFRNQPKTVSIIFRVLSLIVQVIIWIIPVLLLVFGLFGLIDMIF